MNLREKLDRIASLKQELRQNLLDKGYITEKDSFKDYSNALNAYAYKGQLEIDSYISKGAHSEEFYSDAKIIRAGLLFTRSELKKVEFPNAKVVGGVAFTGCDGIEELYLPNVEYVHCQAFAQMDNLKKIVLPKARVVSTLAFASCPKLSYVDLPSLECVVNYQLHSDVQDQSFTDEDKGLVSIFMNSCTSGSAKIWIPSSCTKLGWSFKTSGIFGDIGSSARIYTDAKSSGSTFMKPNGTKLNWTQYWNYRTSSAAVTTYYNSSHSTFERA